MDLVPSKIVSDEDYAEAAKRINESMEKFGIECKSAHANAMNRARDARMGPPQRWTGTPDHS